MLFVVGVIVCVLYVNVFKLISDSGCLNYFMHEVPEKTYGVTMV